MLSTRDHNKKWSMDDDFWYEMPVFFVGIYLMVLGFVTMVAVTRSAIGIPDDISNAVSFGTGAIMGIGFMVYKWNHVPEYPPRQLFTESLSTTQSLLTISTFPGLIAGIVFVNNPLLSGWANPTAAGLVVGLLVGTITFLILLFLLVRNFKEN